MAKSGTLKKMKHANNNNVRRWQRRLRWHMKLCHVQHMFTYLKFGEMLADGFDPNERNEKESKWTKKKCCGFTQHLRHTHVFTACSYCVVHKRTRNREKKRKKEIFEFKMKKTKNWNGRKMHFYIETHMRSYCLQTQTHTTQSISLSDERREKRRKKIVNVVSVDGGIVKLFTTYIRHSLCACVCVYIVRNCIIHMVVYIDLIKHSHCSQYIFQYGTFL